MSGFPLLFCCSSIESTFIWKAGDFGQDDCAGKSVMHEQIRDVVATLG